MTLQRDHEHLLSELLVFKYTKAWASHAQALVFCGTCVHALLVCVLPGSAFGADNRIQSQQTTPASPLAKTLLDITPGTKCSLKWQIILPSKIDAMLADGLSTDVLSDSDLFLIGQGAVKRTNVIYDPAKDFPNVYSGKVRVYGPHANGITTNGSDALYIAYSDDYGGALIAYNRKTASVLWTYYSSNSLPLHGAIMSAPVQWRNTLVFRTGAGLTAIRCSDGEELWNVPNDLSLAGPYVPSGNPVTDGRAIYFNSDAGVAFAVNPSTGETLWRTVTNGQRSESYPVLLRVTTTFIRCAPCLCDDLLIVADGTGIVYGLDKASGSIVWKQNAGYASRITQCSSGLLVATNKGMFLLNPQTGQIDKQLLLDHGARDVAVRGDYAAISRDPRYDAGWEIFDLKAWKVLWSDDTFLVWQGPLISGHDIIVAGEPVTSLVLKQSYVDAPEIRAYELY